MSADTPTPQAVGPHLDELASSAALDGEATTEEQAHLDTCAACRAEVARLRAVQERLAATATDAPDPARRERSIAAALAASERHGGPAPVAPAPFTPAPSTPAAAGGRRRRRTTDLAPWLGIAAVVLLVALAVPLLSRLGGDGADDTAASGAAESESSAADESATAAPARAVDVGDLGPLVAGSDLRPVVDDALGDVGDDVAADGSGSGDAGGGDQAAGGGSHGAPATGEEEGTEAAGGTTETSEAESEADGDEERQDEAATTPSPTAAGGDASQLADGTDGLQASRLTTCEPSVRASLPDAGALLLTGTATVDGAPALVYGFAAPSTRPTVLVALVAVDGCRTITVQTYARD